MNKIEYCIMNDNPPYWRNKRFPGSHRHEIFFGKNRKKSIEDGLVVFLEPKMHNMSKNGVHFNWEFDMTLKEAGQMIWMTHYKKTSDDFRKRYGKNYLEE